MDLGLGLGTLGYTIKNTTKLANEPKVKDTMQKVNRYYNNTYDSQQINNNKKEIYLKFGKDFNDSLNIDSNIVNRIWRNQQDYYKDINNNQIKNILSNDINMIKNLNYNNNNNNIEGMANLDSDSAFSDNDTSNDSSKYKRNINTHVLDIRDKFMNSVISDNDSSNASEGVMTNADVYKKSRVVDSTKDNLNNYINNENKYQNGFLNQFDELKFDYKGLPNTFNNINSAVKLFNDVPTFDSRFKKDSDGRYGVTSDMTHDNMQPNFTSKQKGFDPELQKEWGFMSDRLIELYTGSDQNPQFKHKSEVKPLFDPVTNKVDSVTGTPSFTNFYQSRYIPSDKRQGEKPFQPIKVSPGLNLGYNQTGITGKQDMYRALPKTVDQLRPLTKPKVSYRGEIVPGQKGNNRGIIGELVQKTPDRFYYNTPESMLPTNGDFVGPAIYGKFIFDPTNRSQTTETKNISNIRYIDKSTPEYLQGQFKSPFKVTLGEYGPRNLQYDTRGQNQGRNYVLDPTQRETTADNENVGMGAKGNGVSVPLINFMNYIPDATLKQILLEDNGNQNITNISNSIKSYLYNSMNSIPDDTLRSLISEKIILTNAKGNRDENYLFNSKNAIQDPTIREQTEDNLILTTISNSEKTYLYNNLNGIPDPTLRDLVNTLFVEGGLSFKGNEEKGYIYNYENSIPDTTMRETFENTKDLTNVTGPSGAKKEYMINYKNAIPNTTLRETTENKKYIDNLKGNYGQGYLFNNVNGIPDFTLRSIITDVIQLTNVNGNHRTGYLYNYINSLPDTTLRELTESKIELTNISPLQVKNYLLNYINAIPDTTIREFTEETRNLVGTQGNHKDNYIFNYENGIQDENLRNLIENTKNLTGQNGNHKNNTMFNYENGIQDENLRNTIENLKYLTGQIGNHKNNTMFNYENGIPDETLRNVIEELKNLTGQIGNYRQNALFNYDNNVAHETLREHTENLKNIIGVKSQELRQMYMFNYDDKAKSTLRELIEQMIHITNVGDNILKQSYLFNYDDKPDLTNRNLSENQKNISGTKGDGEQMRSRLDVSNALLNTEKEKVAKGRLPVIVKYNKGPTAHFTNYVFCNDDNASERPLYAQGKSNLGIKNELYPNFDLM